MVSLRNGWVAALLTVLASACGGGGGGDETPPPPPPPDLAGFWVGTWEGISVFDGITFRNLTPADGLPSTYVNCLTELRSEPGTMAAGMNLDGICLIRDFRVTPMRVGPSAEANRVLSLMEDSRGVLWCGTAAGLFRIHHPGRGGEGGRRAHQDHRLPPLRARRRDRSRGRRGGLRRASARSPLA